MRWDFERPNAVRILLLGAAFLCAVASVRASFDPGDGGDSLSRYPPLLLGLSVIVLALSLLNGKSPVSALFALVAAAGALAQIWPEASSSIPQPEHAGAQSPRLSVMTANVWSQNQNGAPFVELVRREQPDILIVQEAFGPWRTALQALAPNYRIVAACQYSSDCNVAIVSKLTFVSSVTAPSFWQASVRLALPARFGGGVVAVMGVHLSRSMPEQRAQRPALTAIARTFGPSDFVAGDFNASPWSATIRMLDRTLPLERRTHLLFSWPTPAYAFDAGTVRAPLPIVPIDHIYAGASWDLIEIHRGPDIGSDHYPVIATFAWRQGAPASRPMSPPRAANSF